VNGVDGVSAERRAPVTSEQERMTPMRGRVALIGVVVGAAGLTLLVSLTSVVHFAYRNPSLHVALETAAALISLLAAQLMYGRFRRSMDRRDLLLACALAMYAGVNLLFSAIPAVANLHAGSFTTWAPALAGTLATGLFTAGAVTPAKPLARPSLSGRRAAALSVLMLAVVAGAVALAGDWLPDAVRPTLSPESADRPRIVGHPATLVLQLVVMALFATAAVGFAIRANRTRDALTMWFAIGATLAAFARLNFFLFPSQHSEFFYTGDVLRLGFFTALLIGGILEIRVAQHQLERAAVLQERQRMARDIHDGMAQDLAFIVQQAGALRDRAVPDQRAVADIMTAAQRALDESRRAISALVRPIDEPLGQAVARVAAEAAERWQATVETSEDADLDLSFQTREAVLRIVGEAVTNAARHGQAEHIRVELSRHRERLVTIADDGVGFDPLSVHANGSRHGLVGMHERAALVGAELHVQSRPGEGTEIVLALP
jgi:signal transduction histidine kinase